LHSSCWRARATLRALIPVSHRADPFIMAKHAIRIVGGTFRRTPIPVIDADGLRPTPDRVRETLFNWLTHLWDGQFADKRVLDLFAGTGALGFEAASRGAAYVELVEKDIRAAAALRKLRDKLTSTEQVNVTTGGAIAQIQRLNQGEPFDLVFLDPPFEQDWLTRLWPLMGGILAPHALVYVESEALPEGPPEFQILRQGKAGKVHYHLFQFAALRK